MIAVRAVIERLLNDVWYENSPLSWLLIPLSWPVGWVVNARRTRAPDKRSTPDGVTVIVVGGLTVGGTGKTPVLIALARWLSDQGYRVGVVSRGYKGQRATDLHRVTEHDSAREVGDEALLIHRELGIPVCVCSDRQRALEALVAVGDANVILSDDGLQHYNMPRDLEIVVLDAHRGLGNGRLLPAGPLREPGDRLASVDWILERNSPDADRGFAYHPIRARHLASGKVLSWQACVDSWTQQDVTAVTGLGQPQQFFDMLRAQGLNPREVALPDHEVLDLPSLNALTGEAILMTSKDAIKLPNDADARLWVVEIEVTLPPSLLDKVTATLAEISPES